MQAAHGWLEQEAQGEAADGKMNDSVKLAFPEWVSLPSDVCVFLCHGPEFMLWACQLLWVLRVQASGRLQIHHTAWKGKGDVYHLVFDVTQFIYGGQCPWQSTGACIAAHARPLLSSCQQGGTLLQSSKTILSSASPGRVWPEEDKGEVELLLMLISHICGMLLACALTCTCSPGE